MKQQLLALTVTLADETVVQALKEVGKPATSESHIWLYASSERSEMPVQIFEYQPSLSDKRPESYLKGFTGFLVTRYNQVTLDAGPAHSGNSEKPCQTVHDKNQQSRHGRPVLQ